MGHSLEKIIADEAGDVIEGWLEEHNFTDANGTVTFFENYGNAAVSKKTCDPHGNRQCKKALGE
jgi:hypothetical protein